ncbi:MAG: glycosyltransferase family 1 protein [Dysgonomonas sp.]
MKILLLGEYSNLHWTLAEGLRMSGHDVTVASDGDGFKNYNRDIDLKREGSGIRDTFRTLTSVLKNLKNFKNYDVVQLINPCFTQLNINVNNYLYDFIRKNNKKVFLGAFGVDSFWLRACQNKDTFRYSEFYVDGKPNNLSDNGHLLNLWLNTKYEDLNRKIAESSDGIIACLYEYYISYKPQYSDKLAYIPLPINTDKICKDDILKSDKINFFLGINKARSNFKGTDRLQDALLKIHEKYPNETEIKIAESIPYTEYVGMLQNSDVVLDQLYSYTPAMNGLIAMAMGKILVGGGEPEMYELLGEKNNMPIINVIPSDEDIINKLEYLIVNKDKLKKLSSDSRMFVEDHHNYKTVADLYIDFWKSKGAR